MATSVGISALTAVTRANISAFPTKAKRIWASLKIYL